MDKFDSDDRLFVFDAEKWDRICEADYCLPEEPSVTEVNNGINAYQCQLEIWGSKVTLIAPRIFTAGKDHKPQLIPSLNMQSAACISMTTRW